MKVLCHRDGVTLSSRWSESVIAMTRADASEIRADASEIPQIFASENIAYISDIHVIIFAYVIDF